MDFDTISYLMGSATTSAKPGNFVKIASYSTGDTYSLNYSEYSEFMIIYVLAGTVRMTEYIPASLFFVGSRWRIALDNTAYFDVTFNSDNTISCQLVNGNYAGGLGEIWAR